MQTLQNMYNNRIIGWVGYENSCEHNQIKNKCYVVSNLHIYKYLYDIVVNFSKSIYLNVVC